MKQGRLVGHSYNMSLLLIILSVGYLRRNVLIECCLMFTTQKRAKSRAAAPEVPMEIRAEKALEAIYVCCFGSDPIEEDDERLLCIMLNAVFPSIGQPGIEKIVKDTIKRVAGGTEEIKFPTPKPLSKEAVQMQMKDLQFLKQLDDTQ